MTNKRLGVVGSSTNKTIMSSMVHPDSAWSKGHMLHAFFEKKCVLSLVVSVSDVQSASDGSAYKRALEEVQMVKCTEVEYDEEPASSAAGPQSSSSSSAASLNKPAKKKSKAVPVPE